MRQVLEAWVKTLWAAWLTLPPMWRKRLVIWSATALGMYVAKSIWDIGTVLIWLFILAMAGIFFGELGAKRFSAIGQWANKQFWGTIRGMVMFAVLPTALSQLFRLVRERSSEALISFLMTLLVMVVVWAKLSEVVSLVTRTPTTRRFKR